MKMAKKVGAQSRTGGAVGESLQPQSQPRIKAQNLGKNRLVECMDIRLDGVMDGIWMY
jgi:hypothetical protein